MFVCLPASVVPCSQITLSFPSLCPPRTGFSVSSQCATQLPRSLTPSGRSRQRLFPPHDARQKLCSVTNLRADEGLEKHTHSPGFQPFPKMAKPINACVKNEGQVCARALLWHVRAQLRAMCLEALTHGMPKQRALSCCFQLKLLMIVRTWG